MDQPMEYYLPMRVSCLFAVEHRRLLCQLAAHDWVFIWRYSGFPLLQFGFLCQRGHRGSAPQVVSLLRVYVVRKLTLQEIEVLPLALPLESALLPGGDYELLPNTPSFECVHRGEFERLERLSERDLRATLAGATIFHYAAALGAVDCFSILIGRLRLFIDTKLLYCCDARFSFGDRVGVLRLLLQHGMNVREDYEGIELLLNSASRFGAEGMLAFVLTQFGQSLMDTLTPALILAATYGHSGCCRLLLEQGADVNACYGYQKWTALTHAAASGRVECVRLLLECGAEVDARTAGGWTALIFASRYGFTECARLLLNRGANVNAVNREGDTAATCASKFHNDNCARLLREWENRSNFLQ